MAKVASPLKSAKLPKDLPGGVVQFACERTISGETGETDKDGKPVKSTVKTIVNFAGPAENTAEGFRNFISLLSDLGKAAGEGEDYGVRFACGALRAAVVSGLSAKLTPETHEKSLSFLPPIPSVRTVDPFEVATAKVGEEYRAKLAEGHTMSKAELAEAFAKLMG